MKTAGVGRAGAARGGFAWPGAAAGGFRSWVAASLLTLAFGGGQGLVWGAENATTPGTLTTPYPTITNLAVEWAIQGDDNLNAAATVRFRKTGAETWREGMPLRRVPAGKSKGTNPIFAWRNKFSGSVFDLVPDTEYEIEVSLNDPDGGKEQKTVTVRTRPVPYAPANAPVKQGQPGSVEVGEPGDIVMLADGEYPNLHFMKDGQPGKPIVYRSTSGKAVLKGLSLDSRKWIYLEGLTFTDRLKLNGTENCVVRRCSFKSMDGIVAYKPGMTNGYIADNVVEGIRPWKAEIMGAGGDNEGEGIQLTGPGNVVCHNKVWGFRDCLSHMEDSGSVNQVCNDWYNNEVSLGLDDGIEADFAQGNCRIMRNRLTNCFVGLSSQPGLGGPTYFIRNVMYNLTYAPYKLHRFSIGDVILHNSVVKPGDGMACFTGEPFDFTLFRNNIAIGGPSGGVKWGGYGCGEGLAASLNAAGPHCKIDYDGIGTFQTPFKGGIGRWRFTELPGAAGPDEYEQHGVAVTMDIFEKLEFPLKPETVFPPQDLRLKAGSVAIDAAEVIPNVNDHFTGRAPDLGAYEFGQELPIYGPRPEGVDELTLAKKAEAGETVRAAGGASPGSSPAVVAAKHEYGPERAPTVELIRARGQEQLGALIKAHPAMSTTMMLGDKATEVTLAGTDPKDGLIVKAYGATQKIAWTEISSGMLAGLIDFISADNDAGHAKHLCTVALLYMIDEKNVESATALTRMLEADEAENEDFKALAGKLK